MRVKQGAVVAGVGYSVASRVAEAEIPEDARERLTRARDVVRDVACTAGDLSLNRPGSWARFAERLLERALDGSKKSTLDKAREELGLKTALALPKPVLTALPHLFDALGSTRVELADGWLRMSALGGEPIGLSSRDGGVTLELNHTGSRPNPEVLTALIEALWDAHPTWRLEDGDGCGALVPADLESSEYRGPELELIDTWRGYLARGVRRAVLIQGAPGCGKSTFCRHAARELSARTLLLDATSMSQMRAFEWFFLLEALSPETLVVDDFERVDGGFRGRGSSHEERLAFLEEGRVDVPLILMTANEHSRLPGALRRPGRIDQIVRFGVANEQVRGELVDEMAARAGVEVPPERRAWLSGMLAEYSAAYVLEALRRASIEGWERVNPGDLSFLMHREFDSDDDWLRAHGYVEHDTHLGAIFDHLFATGRVTTAFMDERDVLELLELECVDGGRATLVRDPEGGRRGGPRIYWRPAEGAARVREAVARAFWRERRIELVDVFERGQLTLLGHPGTPGTYHGPLLEEIPRWRAFGAQGLRRSVLLQGVPGCGKSTFCLHAGRALSDRVLALGVGVLDELDVSGWRELIDWLAPGVLVLDDIDRTGDRALAQKLRVLEEGFCQVPYVFLTSNDHERLPPAMRRPGRIDEIYVLEPPPTRACLRIIRALAAREGVIVPPGREDELVALLRHRSSAHVVEWLRRWRVSGPGGLAPDGETALSLEEPEGTGCEVRRWRGL